MTTVFNTTTSPVYAPSGSVIGGGEWADVDLESVQELIDAGRLIVVSESNTEEVGQVQDENDPPMDDLEGDDSVQEADTMSATVKRSRAKKE